MINRHLKTSCFVILIGIIVAGCEQQQRENGLAYHRSTDPNFVIADYTTSAIEATGGYQAWTKTKKLQFDCVVSFYEPDGSFYLTEHNYEIRPLSNYIRISTQEPLNKFIWQLSKGQFSMLAGNKQNDISELVGFYHDFAEAVLTITTTPVRFLDGEFAFTKTAEPVKMKGSWYEPIQRIASSNNNQLDMIPHKPYWSKVVFYQNKENSLVDTIWFANSSKKIFLTVRGYDYTEIGRNGIVVPTKIEIYRTDARGALLKRLAEINFKLIRLRRIKAI